MDPSLFNLAIASGQKIGSIFWENDALDFKKL